MMKCLAGFDLQGFLFAPLKKIKNNAFLNNITQNTFGYQSNYLNCF